MAVRARIHPAKVARAPFFEPWIGTAYREMRDASLRGETSCCDGLWHIMGEPHYGEADESSPQLTIDIVERLAIPGYRFFDQVLAVGADKEVADLSRASDRGRFAYSNFVQDLLSPDERRPRTEHWETAREAFFGQLALTRPKQLLVVGRAQWNELPVDGYTRLDVPSPFGDGLIPDLGLYAYRIGDDTAFTLATCIYHPSSRGLLDIERARRHVRAVTTVSCNVLSELARDADGWYISADQ